MDTTSNTPVTQVCLTQDVSTEIGHVDYLFMGYTRLPVPRYERFVTSDSPPDDFPVVQHNYPKPTWIDLSGTKDDWILNSIVLPIPRLQVHGFANLTAVTKAEDDKALAQMDEKFPPQELIDALSAVTQTPELAGSLPANASKTKRDIEDSNVKCNKGFSHRSEIRVILH